MAWAFPRVAGLVSAVEATPEAIPAVYGIGCEIAQSLHR